LPEFPDQLIITVGIFEANQKLLAILFVDNDQPNFVNLQNINNCLKASELNDTRTPETDRELRLVEAIGVDNLHWLGINY
jgi:hypothetical protein